MDHAAQFIGGLLCGGVGVAVLALGIYFGRCRAQVRRQREHLRAEQNEAAGLRGELLRHAVREHALQKELERLSAAAGDFECFVGRVAEALHTPMQNASGFAQLLSAQYGTQLPVPAGEYLHYLQQSVGQLAQLLDAMLKLSAAGQRDARFVAVRLQQVWELVEQRHALRIAAMQAEIRVASLPEIEGDPQLLEELFERLLDNALKFQPPGQRPRIHMTARRRGDDWHMVLTDNGLGIPRQRLATVFLPLQRLHEQQEFPGDGLGLAICRKIMQRHRGQIWAEPHEGGAQIHLILPHAQSANAGGFALPAVQQMDAQLTLPSGPSAKSP